LGDLDELENIEGLGDGTRHHRRTSSEESNPELLSKHSNWEDDKRHHLDDLAEEPEEGEDEEFAMPDSPSPTKESLPVPPLTSAGPPTPSKAIPELTYMRTLTQSLVSSLGTISEHAQVNGAGAAEAGRKLRALRNKLGGWKTDWESAERSRAKIERWERDGYFTPDLSPSPSSSSRAESPAPHIPYLNGGRRFDAKRIVEEQLHAFAIVLADANTKTEALLAAS